MNRLPGVARSKLLLGLLSLLMLLTSGLAIQPTVAQEPRVTLEARWLLLRMEDINSAVVQLPDQVAHDARGQVTTRRFEPDWKGREFAPPVPTLILNRLWLANDIATARQIFQEQAGAGFAEAPVTVAGVGGINLPPLGEEARGIGGVDERNDSIVHYRIVFRYLNAVHVLYVFGSNQYAYEGVAVNFANILNERVRAVPTGPPPDEVKHVNPRQVALSLSEMGKEINIYGEEEASDERSRWYWVRFKRTPEYLDSMHFGPLETYNKVWVTPDLETARQIFAEQSLQAFPEATEPVGVGQYLMDNLPGWGHENFGWSACNNDCSDEFTRWYHHRYVMRTGNVVVVLYTYGNKQDNSIEQVSFYAQSIRERIK